MPLHLVHSSPLSSHTLKDCLNLCQAGDAIVLLGEATYLCVDKAFINTNKNAHNTVKIYALADDIEARGLTAPNPIQPITYFDFVKLSEEHTPSVNWG